MGGFVESVRLSRTVLVVDLNVCGSLKLDLARIDVQ